MEQNNNNITNPITPNDASNKPTTLEENIINIEIPQEIGRAHV